MRRVCTECKTINRIPARHLADAGKCGKCHATLPAHDAPFEVSSTAELDEIIAGRAFRSAHNLAGKAIVLEVDIDAQGELERPTRFDAPGR